jgi:hypothetical protein
MQALYRVVREGETEREGEREAHAENSRKVCPSAFAVLSAKQTGYGRASSPSDVAAKVSDCQREIPVTCGSCLA